MKAAYVYPETFGLTWEGDRRWIDFIIKFGYDEEKESPWKCVCLGLIEVY